MAASAAEAAPAAQIAVPAAARERVRVPRPSADDVRVLPAGSLAGRRALVTGAGTGIGRAVALRLVELGAEVTGIGRRLEMLEQTRDAAEGPGRIEVASLDIRDRPRVARFLARFDRLDLLVNNAGGQFVAAASHISVRGFAAVADLNLTATTALTAAARPALAAARGRVVTLSLSAPERGTAGLSHSTTARAAVAGLTADLARDWSADGIRLFTLAPGTVLTAGVGEEVVGSALTAAVDASLLGRDTGVAEVAEWVVAMGSGVFDEVSGTMIELDGGAGLTDAPGALLRAVQSAGEGE